MSTPAGLPWRVITTSCASASRRNRDKSSLTSERGTSFILDFHGRTRNIVEHTEPDFLRLLSRSAAFSFRRGPSPAVAACARSWPHHAPRASGNEFRRRTRPAARWPSHRRAWSGSARAREVFQALAFAVGKADDQGCHVVLLKHSAGVSAARFSNFSSAARKSRLLRVTTACAPPATASSTRWLSASSRRFGRQRK